MATELQTTCRCGGIPIPEEHHNNLPAVLLIIFGALFFVGIGILIGLTIK
jgi:hypothetical protein